MDLERINFSSDSLEAINNALEEARKLRIGYIGTETLTLGILCNPTSLGSSYLAVKGVNYERVFKKLKDEKMIEIGDCDTTSCDFTPRTRLVFGLAYEIAKERENIPLVDTGDLVSGLLKEENGFGAQVIRKISKIEDWEVENEWISNYRKVYLINMMR